MLIWLIGVLCCLWCVKDLWEKSHLDNLVKVGLTVALLCCSWLGLAAYYFIIKDKI